MLGQGRFRRARYRGRTASTSLFEEDWIAHAGAGLEITPGHPSWSRTQRPADLARWEDVPVRCGTCGLFRAGLAEYDRVAVLAVQQDGQHRHGRDRDQLPEVVGFSDFFTRPGAGLSRGPAAWRLASLPFRAWPWSATSQVTSFEPICRLRIWINDMVLPGRRDLRPQRHAAAPPQIPRGQARGVGEDSHSAADRITGSERDTSKCPRRPLSWPARRVLSSR